MFTTPLGLLGLLALPAILAVHLFRRRFRPRTVSALFLWAAVSADPSAGRRREPLRRSASLLLELLAALLLTLALAGPRWGAATEPAHVVAIVDGTASMGAMGSGQETSLARTKAALGSAIGDLPGNARATVIRTGPRPEIVAGPAAFKVEALEVIQGLTAPHPGHDLGAAFDLAIELSRATGAVFITDRPGDAPTRAGEGPERSSGEGTRLGGIETVGVGAALSNVGIVSATRSAKGLPEGPAAADAGPQDELQLVVRSFSGSAESRSLEILRAADGQSLGGGPLELAPYASVMRRYSVPTSAGAVTCRLVREGGDALEADNEAHLSPPPRRYLRVAAALSDDTARALGLGSAAAAAGRWAGILENASAVEIGDPGAHLALVEAQTELPESPSSPYTLRFNAPDSPEDPIHLASPYLIDRAHPLMQGVTLDGVVWTADGKMDPSGTPLIYSGNLVLAAEFESDRGAKEWRFDLDPARSTLGRSPDWPILLANAAEARRAELPGPVRTSLSAGESFFWRCADEVTGGQAWTLTDPAGKSESIEPIPGGDLVTRDLTATGFWELKSGDKLQAEIGVSLLSPGESDLTAGATEGSLSNAVRSLAARSTGDGQGSAGPWTLWLGLLALAAIAGDWWVLQKPPQRTKSNSRRGH